MANKVTGVSYLQGKGKAPAWQNTSTTWKANTAKTYGKYPTTPAPASGEQIASWQDQNAQAKYDVAQAENRKKAGTTSNKLWGNLQRSQADRAVRQEYSNQMSNAGGYGTGRSGGFREPLVSDLVTSESDQFAAVRQEVAERDKALQQVLDEAKARQTLIKDSVSRHKALSGADTAKLIREVRGIK